MNGRLPADRHIVETAALVVKTKTAVLRRHLPAKGRLLSVLGVAVHDRRLPVAIDTASAQKKRGGDTKP